MEFLIALTKFAEPRCLPLRYLAKRYHTITTVCISIDIVCTMGNTISPERPPVHEGKTRICVAGFGISHNVGRAQRLVELIAKTHPNDCLLYTSPSPRD